ncbi:MAG: molecular chaperone DnaJ [Chloroflexi bacterium]|nr:MAG: molecular chaperone DnaJ [Chloroflexota bacterium]
MSEKRDYYDVLGVPRTATDDEIRKAYRRLARQYHPDINKDPGAEDRFKEINEANEVLSNAEQRAAYDRYGHAAFNGGAGGDPFGFSRSSPFGDLFESFFGGSATRSQQRTIPRGGDVKTTIDLSFEEAVFGVEREVQINRYEPCDECGGTRMRGGVEPPTCTNCNGTGEVRRVQNTILGQFMTATTCDRCGGEGKMVTEPCPTCRGRGRVSKTRTIAVNVPPGVDEQATLRITGQGEQVRNGVNGNLFVGLRIKPHKELGRSGKHILYDAPVNIVQATLGDEIQIPTVDGPVTFTVPPGTQPNQQFRLRGKGVPDLRGGERGDQIVTVHVVVPHEVTAEQRVLLEQLSETLGTATLPKERGFFSKVKDALGVS